MSEGDGEGRGGRSASEAQDKVVELGFGIFQVSRGDDRRGVLDHLHGFYDVVARGVVDGPNEGLSEAVRRNARRIDAALLTLSGVTLNPPRRVGG